jgi:MFS family permease
VTAAFARAHARTFASLRKHRNYRLFFSGQVVSVSGTWMQNIATAWLILQLTHSPVAVGVLALCQFLPYTVLGLFAGVVVDRLEPRRTVIATQTVSMVLASVLAGVTLAGVVDAWQVYLLTALRGAVIVLDAPARQALTYRMVGREELPNAVALNSSLFNGARVIGPALGGVLVAAVGVGACFTANAVSFVAVLAGLLMMREEELEPFHRDREPPRLVSGTREALAYVRRSRRAGLVLLTVFLVSTFSFNFNVLLPVIAQTTLDSGPDVFGIISAFFGAGALVGALLSAALGRASMRALIAGTAGFGASELLLAPQSSVAAASLLLFATGVCFTVWTSNANSALQLEAPDDMRGRVIGLYYFAFNGSGPLGGVLTGWLAATGGTVAALLVAGSLSVGAAALLAGRLRGAPAQREAKEPAALRQRPRPAAAAAKERSAPRATPARR